MSDFDAIVIGGGFYGCCLASFLGEQRQNVLMVEREADILTRASFVNQARVHNGYHYPRSFLTAFRSFINFPRFCLEFRSCIHDQFDKVYAIARRNSKVNALQFRKFCERIGAPIKPAPKSIHSLFDETLIEDVFLVKEFAFDAVELRRICLERLYSSGVNIRLNISADKVVSCDYGSLGVVLSDGSVLSCKKVYVCTYAQINTLLLNSGLPLLPMKHEVTEIALIEVPDPLKTLGITVMDGPFFSTMPFPPKNLHSLSHVRYTPHEYWLDHQQYQNAYQYLDSLKLRSNQLFMLRDAQRYLPKLREARYVSSLFEIKTVLEDNEIDDGRPILLRNDYGLVNLCVVMGSKLDNIYDVLQSLKALEQAPQNHGKQHQD